MSEPLSRTETLHLIELLVRHVKGEPEHAKLSVYWLLDQLYDQTDPYYDTRG